MWNSRPRLSSRVDFIQTFGDHSEERSFLGMPTTKPAFRGED
jgi:hypothetical protein